MVARRKYYSQISGIIKNKNKIQYYNSFISLGKALKKNYELGFFAEPSLTPPPLLTWAL